jgi:phosphohistidine swiveling domain-containing protein
VQTYSASTVTLVPLDSPAADANVAGGKGDGLSRLIRGGFPVPAGFVIPTSAYGAFVAANGLTSDLPVGDGHLLRQNFEAGEIPAELADAILAAYHALSGGPVAVRSSANAEDLPNASFAGQQDTYLNVVGDAALLTAVRACWASLWNERAIAYRAHQQIDSTQLGMAVVVQQMVAADAAGVLFTVNPVTGNDAEIVINATWGLGEALVSGRVAPDTIVVEKTTGTITQLTVGDKALMTVPAPNGTTEIAVDSARRMQPALSAAQTIELARLGQAIEAHMGSAQDIEWALAGARLVILQARAVTTVAPKASEVPGDDAWPTPDVQRVHPFDLWTHADMGERWPEPVTPLTWSFACMMTSPNTRFAMRDVGGRERDDIAWARRFYGRVYMNEGAVAEMFSRAGFPTSIVDLSFGSGVPAKLRRAEPLNSSRLLRRLPRLVRVAMERRRNEAAYEAFFPAIERWVGDFQRRDIGAFSDRELWTEYLEVWWPRVLRGINFHADATSQALSMMALLDGLLKRLGEGPELARQLVTGIANLRSAEMAPALWSIAQQLRQTGLEAIVLDKDPSAVLDKLRAVPAAAPVLEMLERFLEAHGHRAKIEAELRYPRWSEAPEQVVEALVGFLGDTAARDPRAVESDNRRRHDAAARALDTRLAPWQRWMLNGMVARTRRLVRLRDNGQHYLVKLLLPVRRLFAEFGLRWAARGWLTRPDDVFFLDFSELSKVVTAGDPAAAGLDLVSLAARRRLAYEHWFTVAAPEVIDAQGRPVPPEAQEGETPTRLVGIPASGGRVSGTARIAHSPQEAAQLRQGEILVARSTDPGWTPAFALASGLVLEVGGQLSHGAIVAREFGLPAVVNVRDALGRIRMGQRIIVDGTVGAVYLED